MSFTEPERDVSQRGACRPCPLRWRHPGRRRRAEARLARGPSTSSC